MGPFLQGKKTEKSEERSLKPVPYLIECQDSRSVGRSLGSFESSWCSLSSDRLCSWALASSAVYSQCVCCARAVRLRQNMHSQACNTDSQVSEQMSPRVSYLRDSQ